MSICVGVGNKARRVKRLYVGINGKARKIKKAYIGVNGKARLCYKSGFGNSPEGLYLLRGQGSTTKFTTIDPTTMATRADINTTYATIDTVKWDGETMYSMTNAAFAGTAGKIIIGSKTTNNTVFDPVTGASLGNCPYKPNYGSDQLLGKLVGGNTGTSSLEKINPEAYNVISSVTLDGATWNNNKLSFIARHFGGGDGNVIYRGGVYAISYTFYVLCWHDINSGAVLGTTHASDNIGSGGIEGAAADVLGQNIFGCRVNNNEEYQAQTTKMYKFDKTSKAEVSMTKLSAPYVFAMCTIK